MVVISPSICAEVIGVGSKPMRRNFSPIPGSAMTLRSVASSRSTIGFGVAAGANSTKCTLPEAGIAEFAGGRNVRQRLERRVLHHDLRAQLVAFDQRLGGAGEQAAKIDLAGDDVLDHGRRHL